MNVLSTTLHFRICFLGSLTFHRGSPAWQPGDFVLVSNTLATHPPPVGLHLLCSPCRAVCIHDPSTARQSTLTLPLPGGFQDPCLLLHLVP